MVEMEIIHSLLHGIYQLLQLAAMGQHLKLVLVLFIRITTLWILENSILPSRICLNAELMAKRITVLSTPKGQTGFKMKDKEHFFNLKNWVDRKISHTCCQIIFLWRVATVVIQ